MLFSITSTKDTALTIILGICPLEILFLSSNRLSGTVPSEIVGLKEQLRGLYLSDNQFVGSISEALCGLEQLGTSYSAKCSTASIVSLMVSFWLLLCRGTSLRREQFARDHSSLHRRLTTAAATVFVPK